MPEADKILVDATSLLVNNDGIGDVSCLVLLQRRGDVTVFNNGTGFINTQADFNAINNLPGRVKVVNQISFCGTFNNFLGCAPIPGTSQIVVARFPYRGGSTVGA